MKVDISDLLKQVGNELNIDESEALNYESDNLFLSGPVRMKLNLINTGRTVLLKGRVKVKIRLNCCRCLKDFDLPMDIEVEEQYSRAAGKAIPADNKEIELEKDDFIFPISEDNKIDLTEAIRQNIITSLPIKPLCNKACKLQIVEPKGGRSVDPRLSGLKTIKDKIKGGYHASTKEKTF